MAKTGKQEKRPAPDVVLDEIRARAEEIYKKRVALKKQGDELSDWIQAEKEVKDKYGLK